MAGNDPFGSFRGQGQGNTCSEIAIAAEREHLHQQSLRCQPLPSEISGPATARA